MPTTGPGCRRSRAGCRSGRVPSGCVQSSVGLSLERRFAGVAVPAQGRDQTPACRAEALGDPFAQGCPAVAVVAAVGLVAVFFDPGLLSLVGPVGLVGLAVEV